MKGNEMTQEKRLVDDAIIVEIDMLNDFLLPGVPFELEEGRKLIPGIKDVLEFARENGIPIIHGASQDMDNSMMDYFWPTIADRTSCVSGTTGVDVVEELRPAEYSQSEVYVPKAKPSLFYGSRADSLLRNQPFKDRNTMIIVGMATAGCCLSTAIDAFHRDYNVIVVDDLQSTVEGKDGRSAEDMHQSALSILGTAFATQIVTHDELMSHLRNDLPLGAAAKASFTAV